MVELEYRCLMHWKINSFFPIFERWSGLSCTETTGVALIEMEKYCQIFLHQTSIFSYPDIKSRCNKKGSCTARTITNVWENGTSQSLAGFFNWKSIFYGSRGSVARRWRSEAYHLPFDGYLSAVFDTPYFWFVHLVIVLFFFFSFSSTTDIRI